MERKQSLPATPLWDAVLGFRVQLTTEPPRVHLKILSSHGGTGKGCFEIFLP